MRNVWALVFLIVYLPAFAQKDVAWYKVTKADNEIWDIESHISITKISSDSVLFGGFSDHGASVIAIIRGNSIKIPKQTVAIIPYGGGGKLRWNIVAEAEGSITNGSLIELQYYFAKDTFETRGTISAVRYIDGVLHKPGKRKK